MDGLTLVWGTIVSFGALLAWLINIARNDPALYQELEKAFAVPVLLLFLAAVAVLLCGASQDIAYLRSTEGKLAAAALVFTMALVISTRMLKHIANMPPEKRMEASPAAHGTEGPRESP